MLLGARQVVPFVEQLGQTSVALRGDGQRKTAAAFGQVYGFLKGGGSLAQATSLRAQFGQVAQRGYCDVDVSAHAAETRGLGKGLL